MGNHLHEVLDCKTLGIYMDTPNPQQTGQSSLKLLREFMHGAICFDLGHLDKLTELDSPALATMPIQLPFETTWFEFSYTLAGTDGIFALLAVKYNQHEAVLHVFNRRDSQWWYCFSGPTAENMRALPIDERPNTFPNDVRLIVLHAVVIGLCAMQCVNIGREEHIPSTKLQKARTKRGKLPLFSYWTLCIGKDANTNSESLGGTHTSPRLHLRRGHPREYKPGMYCWVQPHLVGDKSKGLIHKDYELKDVGTNVGKAAHS